jgi:hypothetical protein
MLLDGPASDTAIAPQAAAQRVAIAQGFITKQVPWALTMDPLALPQPFLM